MTQEQWIGDAWEQGVRKVKNTSLRVGAAFPHGSNEGQFQLTSPHYWTAGFWPGILWLIYQDRQDEQLRLLAESCETQMDTVIEAYEALDHDMGFMWTLTAITNWHLTGNEQSKRRALKIASHLAGRFNIKGSFIRAWNHPERVGWAIIDCLMNLPVLYWATQQTGDPRFKHIAEAHAEMVTKQFIRKDGSAYHVVCFDPETGERTGALGGQGYAEESAWARGSAWSIYGSVLSYRHTGRADLLEAAEHAAGFFLSHLPEDKVPYWDFRLPTFERASRDTSAAAIAASGLLDLAEVCEGDRALFYKEQACAILQSLTQHYRADDSEEAILLSGTGNLPGNQNINKPLIYGDYYYMEALAKLKGYPTFSIAKA
ncbi:glycoside hydrolase family 88 protein [Paenibacillus qinlingensis]|uniref:Unsaturated chondroitin disaccharide hydrolase n=1 Tax=Paenibacillus qinlingensis TaxID=1837343 RepID=A0ABU1NSK0_9BACL|nr:glycoside hydrolase family 88 protein [Paenibacillus qinlingensis]MDR6550466.1 unsaturated chondroitin disaccharide hydrolase [Paenibacillus qinlingensis]